jgi:hypothetical protein
MAKPKIGPNTTAPKNLKRVGPNGSMPIGDRKHDRLAIGGATRSQNAGNISASTAARIKREARADLAAKNGRSANSKRK